MVIVARARPESVYYNNIYTHGVPNYTHFLRRKRYRTGKRSGTVYFDCLSPAFDRLAKNKKTVLSQEDILCAKKSLNFPLDLLIFLLENVFVDFQSGNFFKWIRGSKRFPIESLPYPRKQAFHRVCYSQVSSRRKTYDRYSCLNLYHLCISIRPKTIISVVSEIKELSRGFKDEIYTIAAPR